MKGFAEWRIGYDDCAKRSMEQSKEPGSERTSFAHEVEVATIFLLARLVPLLSQVFGLVLADGFRDSEDATVQTEATSGAGRWIGLEDRGLRKGIGLYVGLNECTIERRGDTHRLSDSALTSELLRFGEHRLGVFRAIEVDEAGATGAIRLPVHGDTSILHRSEALEAVMSVNEERCRRAERTHIAYSSSSVASN